MRQALLHDQGRRGAVSYLARTTGGDTPTDFGEALLHRLVEEGPLKSAQRLHRAVAADAFVPRNDNWALFVRHRDRDDCRRGDSAVPGGAPPIMRLRRQT